MVGYFAFGPLHQADLGFIVAFAVAAVLYRALQRRPATPRHANPGNPAVTAAPAGGKPDGQPGRDAREDGAKVHDRTGLWPLPPGRPGCATAGLLSTEVDCLPALPR